MQFLTGGIGVNVDAPIAEQVSASRAYYDDLTGLRADGALFDGGHSVLWFWVITVVLNTYFVLRGLSKGIETFCRWAMPTMAIFAVIVLIRVMTLGTPDLTKPDQNVVNGLGFMWNPNFDKLLVADTWIAASGQIFFSLSVGFGVIINYASYMRKKDDVVLSGLTASSTNELFEVGFGGLITIPAAFIFLGASGAIAGTFGMGFNTLPVVFARMPLGNLIGAIWFFMLFLAAITSSLSMLQPAKAFFAEALGVSPRRATWIVTVLSLLGCSFVLYYSHGPVDKGAVGVALGTIDDWVGTFLITVLAAVQVICFAWVFGINRGMREAMRGAQMRIPRVFKVVFVVIAPAYLLGTIGWSCYETLPKWIDGLQADATAMMAMGLVGLVVVLLVVCTAIGERRWREAGLDLDGKLPVEEAEPVVTARR
jgi:SNF family Na+-dependent transporter